MVPAAPTYAPTAEQKSRQDRDGFGKRSMNLHSLGVNRNTAATMLNSPTDRN